MEASIPHWDIAVREVASESMARIAVLDLDYACSEIIPKLVCEQVFLYLRFRYHKMVQPIKMTPFTRF